MKKYVKALANISITLIILLLVIWLLPKTIAFFIPFVIGWIISAIAAPLVRFFEEKVKIKRKAGSAMVIIVVIAIIVLALYALCSWLVEQCVGLVSAIPEMWRAAEIEFNNAGNSLQVLISKLPKDFQATLDDAVNQVGTYFGSIFESWSSPTIEAIGNIAKSVPSVIVGIVMCLLSAYFFVAERDQIGEWCREHTPKGVQNAYNLIRDTFVKAVGGYFKAQLKIEVWVYILLIIGLLILRVNYAVLIGLGIAILDFLPIFGTGTVMIPWALVKLFNADYRMGIGLIITWGVGQLVRQIIQPKIVGDSVGLAPVPTLFLLYIGYKVGGVMGMIVAIPVGMIFYTLYEAGVFDTTRDSFMVLAAGLNRFRQLKDEDMWGLPERKYHGIHADRNEQEESEEETEKP